MSTNGTAQTEWSADAHDRPILADLVAEKCLLGSIFLKPDLIDELATFHTAADFIGEYHGHIFSAMLALRSQGKPVDPTLLVPKLKVYDESPNWVLLLADIARVVPHALNGPHYSALVRDVAQRRMLILANQATINAAYNGLVPESLLAAQAEAVERARGCSLSRDLVFERLTSAELAALDDEIPYLIDSVWPANQPGIISGLFKVLKTGVAVDLGMSGSLGVDFLRRFRVSRAFRCGIMSAESGTRTLRERGQAIAASKGITLADCSNLIWSTASPRLARIDHLAALRKFIRNDGLEGLIIDPTYLALCDIGSDASNLFKMGAVLAPITELIRETGCSIILVNHNTKGRSKDLARFDPPGLAEVSMSGFMEWARFWCLLGPRQDWNEDTGEHWLWLRTGGSAGHAGLWHLDVAEGKRSDPAGRRWEVSLCGASEGQRSNEAARKEAKDDAKRRTRQEHKAKITAAMRKLGPETKTIIRTLSGVNGRYFDVALADLFEEGSIVMDKIIKAGKGHDALKLQPEKEG